MTLVRLSHLISDFASIEELDINPLLADANGVIALDARVRVAYSDAAGHTELRGLPPGGIVSVSVSKDGYERCSIDDVVARDIDDDPETITVRMRSRGVR